MCLYKNTLKFSDERFSANCGFVGGNIRNRAGETLVILPSSLRDGADTLLNPRCSLKRTSATILEEPIVQGTSKRAKRGAVKFLKVECKEFFKTEPVLPSQSARLPLSDVPDGTHTHACDPLGPFTCGATCR